MTDLSGATPAAAAARRGVEELLHYTTQRGLHGMIASSAVVSRARLETDEYLSHIREPVWPRKDTAWIDHISLSVTSINDDLFFRSRNHFPSLWWGIVSIEPSIIDDHDVVFTTTNNIYPSVQRGRGLERFEAMFADPVVGRYGVVKTRAGLPESQPTDRAAEVLYPGALSTDRVRAVYVLKPEHKHTVLAWCEALDHADLRVEIRPEVFA